MSTDIKNTKKNIKKSTDGNGGVIKSFWIKIVIILISWLPVIFIVVFIDPYDVKDVVFNNIFFPFIVAVGVGVLISSYVLLNKVYISIVTMLLVCFTLIWQFLGVLNIFNVILVLIWLLYLFIYTNH